MKTIDVYIAHNCVKQSEISGRLVFVVDILRASTTIITAFSNGAVNLYPALSIDEAFKLREDHPNALLCGERNARIVEGFDLGNSPFEYSSSVVAGKELIFASTNGSKALISSQGAQLSAVAALTNLSAAVKMSESFDSIAVICSGVNSRFSMEDFYFAGHLVMGIKNKTGNAVLNDQAQVSELLALNNSDIREVIENSLHGRYLKSIGYDRDVDYASQVDTFDTVPIYSDGKLFSRI